MKSQNRAVPLDLISQAVAARDYKTASSLVATYSRAQRSKLPVPDRVLLFNLHGQCLQGTGEYRRAMIKFKVAARLSQRLNYHPAYAEAKFRIGCLLLRQGKYAEAIEDLNTSYVFFKRERLTSWLIAPLDALAQASFLKGDLSRSRELLNLAVSHSLASEPTERTARHRRNLARVYLYSGDLAKSKILLDEVRDLTASDYVEGHGPLLYGYHALLCLDSTRASDELSRAVRLFGHVQSQRDINVCQEYLGLLEYNRGNYKKAREYYQQVLDTPEPTASAIAQTLRMLTDVEIAEGNWDAALETAKKAEAAITKINERIELGALWRAHGQLHTHSGEHDTARSYFRKSIDLLREIGARYELALSYLASGRSESYSREERKFNLEMARMLFAEMEVPKRIEQVEQAIADMRFDPASVPMTRVSRKAQPVVVVASPRMQRLVEFASRVAGSQMSVFLTGDTGVGKDLLARYIHHCSGRSGEFVMVNCAAIPNDMIESELFGFSRGAFTGAGRNRPGLMETAEDGTFYLNEIADATPEFQTKLLEVLETREVRRLGENRSREVNFRLIAATNHDIELSMRENRFRHDLYHRISEIPIRVPSLRERPEDVPALVKHFLLECGWHSGNGASAHVPRLIEVLTNRRWPGNVRQLQSEIKRLWLESRGDVAAMVELASSLPASVETDGLLEALESTNWNRRETARVLGVSETTVRNRIRRFNLA